MLENYAKILLIEANTMLEMAQRQILPAVVEFASECAAGYNSMCAAGFRNQSLHDLLRRLSARISEISDAIGLLKMSVEEARRMEDVPVLAEYCRGTLSSRMEALRAAADGAESIVPSQKWPMPSYTDLLHRV